MSAVLGDEEHLLLLTQHHIVSDGWSCAVMIRELGALYDAALCDAPSPLPELPIQYADYAVWQRQALEGDVLEAQLDYWRGQLSGLAELDLPTDHSRRGGIGPSFMSRTMDAGSRPT